MVDSQEIRRFTSSVEFTLNNLKKDQVNLQFGGKVKVVSKMQQVGIIKRMLDSLYLLTPLPPEF